MDAMLAIPTGELFRDLQVSLTKIVLCEMIGDKSSERYTGNKDVVEAIKKILRERYDDGDLEKFLEHGYPRAIH